MDAPVAQGRVGQQMPNRIWWSGQTSGTFASWNVGESAETVKAGQLGANADKGIRSKGLGFTG